MQPSENNDKTVKSDIDEGKKSEKDNTEDDTTATKSDEPGDKPKDIKRNRWGIRNLWVFAVLAFFVAVGALILALVYK